ncbi:MAG: ANTAR domain-containing protein [Pseudomonadota bacterium]
MLKVAVVDENPNRAEMVAAGLREAGDVELLTLASTSNLLRNLVAFAPDVVLIDLDDPGRDVLEQMFEIGRVVERPVAMFVDRAEEGDIQRAIEAGVSAYVVDGLKPGRIRSVLDGAIARYRAFENLKSELEETKGALADRRDIDRVKALIMKRQGVGEDEAYRLLRDRAMKERRRMGDLARSLLDADSLLRGDKS